MRFGNTTRIDSHPMAFCTTHNGLALKRYAEERGEGCEITSNGNGIRLRNFGPDGSGIDPRSGERSRILTVYTIEDLKLIIG